MQRTQHKDYNPLFWAIREKHVNYLLSQKININILLKNTSLSFFKPMTFEYLCKKINSLTQTNPKKLLTILTVAFENGHLGVTNLMLNHFVHHLMDIIETVVLNRYIRRI